MPPYYGPARGRLTGLFPVPGQRHELDRNRAVLHHALARLLDNRHPLWPALRTNRDDKAATNSELFDQRVRDVVGSRRRHDAVEGRLLGPPAVAVAKPAVHVVQTEISKQLGRTRSQLWNDLDSPDLAREAREHGSLKRRPGPDFVHSMRLAHIDHLGHVRHDVRLGDGLVERDGKRYVVVGLGMRVGRDEALAWNGFHRAEHTGIGHTPLPDLPLDHVEPALTEGVVGRSGLLQPPVGNDLHDSLAVKAAVL